MRTVVLRSTVTTDTDAGSGGNPAGIDTVRVTGSAARPTLAADQ
jgi:hypothetical protein